MCDLSLSVNYIQSISQLSYIVSKDLSYVTTSASAETVYVDYKHLIYVQLAQFCSKNPPGESPEGKAGFSTRDDGPFKHRNWSVHGRCLKAVFRAC